MNHLCLRYLEQPFLGFLYKPILLQISCNTTEYCFPVLQPPSSAFLLPTQRPMCSHGHLHSTAAWDANVPGPNEACRGNADGRPDCSFELKPSPYSLNHLEGSSRGRFNPSLHRGKPWPKPPKPFPITVICLHFAKKPAQQHHAINGKLYDELQDAKLAFTGLPRARDNSEVQHDTYAKLRLVRMKVQISLKSTCYYKEYIFLLAKF